MMNVDWTATAVIVPVIGIMCGLFYRLGVVQSSKADKVDCQERLQTCGIRFDSLDGVISDFKVNVARLEEQQRAHSILFERQVKITDRLDDIVSRGIRNGIIGNSHGGGQNVSR